MDTVKVKALKSFTEFVSGYGMIHGDPEGTKEGKNPSVPKNLLAKLIEDGCIEQPKGWSMPDAEAEAAETETIVSKAPEATKVP